MLSQIHLDEFEDEVERTLRAANIQQLDLVNAELLTITPKLERFAL